MHPWRRASSDRLIAATDADGAWGYRSGGTSGAEPTALAAMALAINDASPATWTPALAALAAWQQPDGAVRVSADTELPGWPTGLAVLAWTIGERFNAGTYSANIERASQWLIRTSGTLLPPRPDILGHNTRLHGWPWVEGTHSWVEPTACAVMALRATSNSDHPRVREANELLRDRAVASGGWNYGNPRVFGADLRPFPETTGVALAALAGESRCRRIDQAIAYLAEEWPTLRSPMSLAWSVIGLSAWDARPSDADRRLAEASGRWSETPQTNANDALLLIAGSASGAMIGVSADAAIH